MESVKVIFSYSVPTLSKFGNFWSSRITGTIFSIPVVDSCMEIVTHVQRPIHKTAPVWPQRACVRSVRTSKTADRRLTQNHVFGAVDGPNAPKPRRGEAYLAAGLFVGPPGGDEGVVQVEEDGGYPIFHGLECQRGMRMAGIGVIKHSGLTFPRNMAWKDRKWTSRPPRSPSTTMEAM